MLRKIIQIDETKCDGCGLCAAACHEGAIGMVEGKAKLLRGDYCDGLGDCLSACPAGAITFIEREAPAYDAAAVLKSKSLQETGESRSCPGSLARRIDREDRQQKIFAAAASDTFLRSELRQWPVQIKLAPVKAPYFDGAHLLIAADCTAYAYGNFHRDFIRGTVALIGCPKLDACDYSQKLTELLRQNDIRRLTIVRMEVPCCGGIEQASVAALKNSGKFLPWRVITISTDGKILED